MAQLSVPSDCSCFVPVTFHDVPCRSVPTHTGHNNQRSRAVTNPAAPAPGTLVDPRDAKVEVRMVGTVPEAEPVNDPLLGPQAHAALRERIGRLALLAVRAGQSSARRHAGTTSGCLGCGRVEGKSLAQRVHDCPACGLRLPRDQALAIMALGRTLLPFHDAADPAGSITQAVADKARVANARRRARPAGVSSGVLGIWRLKGRKVFSQVENFPKWCVFPCDILSGKTLSVAENQHENRDKTAPKTDCATGRP